MFARRLPGVAVSVTGVGEIIIRTGLARAVGEALQHRSTEPADQVRAGPVPIATAALLHHMLVLTPQAALTMEGLVQACLLAAFWGGAWWSSRICCGYNCWHSMEAQCQHQGAASLLLTVTWLHLELAGRG